MEWKMFRYVIVLGSLVAFRTIRILNRMLIKLPCSEVFDWNCFEAFFALENRYGSCLSIRLVWFYYLPFQRNRENYLPFMCYDIDSLKNSHSRAKDCSSLCFNAKKITSRSWSIMFFRPERITTILGPIHSCKYTLNV